MIPLTNYDFQGSVAVRSLILRVLKNLCRRQAAEGHTVGMSRRVLLKVTKLEIGILPSGNLTLCHGKIGYHPISR